MPHTEEQVPSISTYACRTTAVRNNGTLEVHYTLQKYITNVTGTPWVGTELPVHLPAVKLPLFYFVGRNF